MKNEEIKDGQRCDSEAEGPQMDRSWETETGNMNKSAEEEEGSYKDNMDSSVTTPQDAALFWEENTKPTGYSFPDQVTAMQLISQPSIVSSPASPRLKSLSAEDNMNGQRRRHADDDFVLPTTGDFDPPRRTAVVRWDQENNRNQKQRGGRYSMKNTLPPSPLSCSGTKKDEDGTATIRGPVEELCRQQHLQGEGPRRAGTKYQPPLLLSSSGDTSGDEEQEGVVVGGKPGGGKAVSQNCSQRERPYDIASHMLLENIGKKSSNCYLCSIMTTDNIKRTSIYSCIQCERGFHVNCFALYHFEEEIMQHRPELVQLMHRRESNGRKKRRRRSNTLFSNKKDFRVPFPI